MSWQPGGWQPEGSQPEPPEPSALDVRLRFRFRRHLGSSCGVTKHPSESLKVRLDLFEICANYREPNESYDAGDFVRPELPNGFEFECTVAGLSGRREPVWSRSIGSNTIDGAVTWTCRAAGANGVMAISDPTGAADPSGGLTISDVSVEETTKILATYAGGVHGQDYEAVFTFTLNGVTRVVRQAVKVRRR